MSGRLTRRTWAALAILLLAIPALMAVFVCVWDERKYYLTSLLLVGLMFVPFVLRFEGRRPQARELVLLATMALPCAMLQRQGTAASGSSTRRTVA